MRITKCTCSGEVCCESPISFSIAEDEIEGKAFACNLCGKLYWGGGTPVRNRHRHQAFVIGGKGVLKDNSGQISGSFEVMQLA